MANVVADALSRKKRVKPKRVQAMSITIQSSVKEKLLATQNEVTKEENMPAEMMHKLDQQMEKKRDGGLYFMYRIWVPFFGTCIGGQETTDKVVIIKERLKAARDRQKSYADNWRKLLEFEEGDRVLIKVSPLKGAVWFEKKGKLAQIYVGPFEILERIGLVAYRFRLPQELNGESVTTMI
nr:putative reverse transcriptase domain-containing protein [Tanacetum cinerariifolium]